jgi:hypothetical protein
MKRTVRRRIRFWWNRTQLDLQWKRDGWKSHLILHERFRGIVRGLKAVVTALGLLIALVEFSSVLVAFAIAVAIWLVTSFIEKTVFSYNSMYVHAMPEFELKPDLWLGAFFGYAQRDDRGDHIPVVGWMMGDADYARKVHQLLLRWTYGAVDDQEHNICASVILLSSEEYVFYLYPSFDRKTAKAFFNHVEQERRQESLSDVLIQQFAMLTFGKCCDITPRSYLPTFRARYRDGVPYLFQLALLREGDDVPQPIPGISDMILHNLKIKSKEELDRKDVEYHLIRMHEDNPA